MNHSDLYQRQSLPLDLKIILSNQRIRDYYDHFDGEVYVSFSGGKDSTVLLDLVRKIYPDVEAVFSDTGLEYLEIRDFVKSVENVRWVKPKKGFKQVIEEYGFPIISKKVSRYLHDLQNQSDNNAATCNLRMTGINRLGEYCSSQKLPNKYRYLINAPFKISEKCCDYIKKEPIKAYVKVSNKHPYMSILASESNLREKEYLKYGCNVYDTKSPFSQPLGFWTEQDILKYIKKNNLKISPIYGDIIEKEGLLLCSGEQRTGCMFCMFGLQFDGTPNRFQRMKKTPPSQYNYCMDKLGLKNVLAFMGINYE